MTRPDRTPPASGLPRLLGALPLWLLLLPFGVSFALAAWALPRQPERVPVHWNAAGQPDRWGSPAQALLVLPGSLLFGALVVLAAARAGSTSQPLLKAVVLGLGLMALGDVAAQAFGWNSFRVTMGTLGLLFLLVGPALGASGPSALNGPRLSRATLRRLGQAWTLLGALVMLASLFAPAAVWITATLLVGLPVLGLAVIVGARQERDTAQ